MKHAPCSLVVLLASASAQGALVARWTFDAETKPNRFPIQIANASGQAGLRSERGRTLFSIPGTHQGDHVTLGEGQAFDLPTRFTLEAWFRPHPAPLRCYTMILGKRYNRQFQLTWTSSGGGVIEFYVGGGHLQKNRSWATRVPNLRWLHVVAAYDSTVQEGPNQWLYLNGRLVHKTRNEVKLRSDSGPLRIAQNSVLNLNGGVPADWDEVAIHDHALTAAEVTAAFARKAVKPLKVAGREWKLPLTRSAWRETARPGRAAASARDAMSGIVQRNVGAMKGDQSVTAADKALYFQLAGDPPTAVSGTWRHELDPPVDLSAFTYARLTYRALGLRRTVPSQTVLALEGDAGRVPLVTSSHLVLDGHVRTCLVKLKPVGTVDRALVILSTHGTVAELELHEARLLRETELTPVPSAGENPNGLIPLKLSTGTTRSLESVLSRAIAGRGHAVHAPLQLSGQALSLEGIPFQPGPGGAIWWPKETNADAEEVMALGQSVTRRSFLRTARDETLSVPVGRRVCEVFLLLACDFPAVGGRYSRPAIPWAVTDVEAIDVELIYADGRDEWALPYSLRDHGYRVMGLVGAYAVTADPARKLQRLVLHNRIRDRSAGIAAITVNTGDRRLPELVREPKLLRAPVAAPVDDRARSVRESAGMVRLGNGHMELVVDCRDGFSIRELRNRRAPHTRAKLHPESGLEVHADGVVLTGRDFRTAELNVHGNRAQIRLVCRREDVPLTLVLTLRIDAGPNVLMHIEAHNTGKAELRADVRFPVLKGLRLGEHVDTWLFFPQYRNVLTNDEVLCKQANHRSFTMQFMDVFNPVSGGGVALLTRNLEQEPVQYALSKNAVGVTTYIESEGEDFPLAPGATVRFCDRVLALHAGDWHEAAALYAKWMRSWYRPKASQDKPWFRHAVWTRSHCTSPANAKRITHLPPIYDKPSGTWRTDAYLAADQRFLGLLPDIVHFYVWAFDKNPGGDPARDGEYGHKDYANLGGLGSFRAAIDHIRRDRRMPVSLYTIWDRCNRDTEFVRKHGDRFARVRSTGQRLANSRKIHLSQGVPEWRAHAARTLQRLQTETGADILYLDVFGTDDRARCFNTKAGHAHVPSRVAHDDAEFLKALRQVLPSEVVLWGEFPVPDVASQYWDGFMMYDCIPLHTYLAEPFDQVESAPQWSSGTLPPNVSRFLFPRLRQIVFPVGTEGPVDSWRYLKFLLFNGQALFDTTWRLYNTRCRERLGRALRIMKAHADCFDSPTPEMFVPTERAHLFANRWPGKGRTVWTLFNGRYRTLTGPVLRVAHVVGATYRDLWNDYELKPRVVGNEAVLELRLSPQGIGCVLQRTSQ